MTKYRVKKRHHITYPDGTIRGEVGYIVDSAAPGEARTLAEQGDALERVRDRQAQASPVLQSLVSPESAPSAKKKTKKKTTKKKASKK